jgi:predicted ArsR family transcriptional regulator
MSEREEIVTAIRSTGSITKAAKRLGIHRRTLQDRMRALGLAESKDRASVLGGLGKRGRPKKKFKRHARTYAAIGAAVLAVGVGVAMTRKPTIT